MPTSNNNVESSTLVIAFTRSQAAASMATILPLCDGETENRRTKNQREYTKPNLF